MQTGPDIIIKEFREASVEIFFSMFSAFEKAARGLDREKDDNVFQQLQGRYVSDLEIKLKNMATSMLDRYHNIGNSDRLRHELTLSIAQYLHEFIAKARSL